MRVLVFRHEPACGLGTVQPALERRGVAIECVDLYAGDPLPDPRRAAGLVFLGGAMCANDRLDFLERELDIIRDAASRAQPIFGICLGAQLIAKALGGKVYKNAVQESGWQDLHLDRSAVSDPVLAASGVWRVFQLHQDTFDLPSGAVRLATSPACANQAFRCGANVYAVQFHPEMTPAMVGEWSRDLALPQWPETPASCAALARTCDRLVAGWRRLL